MYIYINQYSLFLLVIFFTGKIHVFAIKWNKNMRKSMVNPKKTHHFQVAKRPSFPVSRGWFMPWHISTS